MFVIFSCVEFLSTIPNIVPDTVFTGIHDVSYSTEHCKNVNEYDQRESTNNMKDESGILTLHHISSAIFPITVTSHVDIYFSSAVDIFCLLKDIYFSSVDILCLFKDIYLSSVDLFCLFKDIYLSSVDILCQFNSLFTHAHYHWLFVQRFIEIHILCE
jgi:hypothetical protein